MGFHLDYIFQTNETLSRATDCAVVFKATQLNCLNLKIFNNFQNETLKKDHWKVQGKWILCHIDLFINTLLELNLTIETFHLITFLVFCCFSTQLPQYASTASVYQPEMASPAPAVASQPGVTNKVSAWLQQTEDIDSTSNGQCLIRKKRKKKD